MIRKYYALICADAKTEHHELRFEHHPTIKEVLQELHCVVRVRQNMAMPLIVNIQHYSHVSGQEQELFNETTIFHYARDRMWMRIYCPMHAENKLEI